MRPLPNYDAVNTGLCRVHGSPAKQADKDSPIPDQVRQVRDLCSRNGLSVGQEYIVPGASATDDKRPALQQMISCSTTKCSPFEIVLMHSPSSFSVTGSNSRCTDAY
jgi:hypothetical protein